MSWKKTKLGELVKRKAGLGDNMNNNENKTRAIAPKKRGWMDERGDLVVKEADTEEATVRTVTYGVIKLIGDPTEHRVSYKTLKEIVDKPPLFNGNIIIEELRLKTPLNRIIFQQFREEEQRTLKNFAKLPTATVRLYKNEDRVIVSKDELEAQDEYREAIAHYQTNSRGEHEYYLERERLKVSLYMKKDTEGYPPFITRIEKYGIEQKM